MRILILILMMLFSELAIAQSVDNRRDSLVTAYNQTKGAEHYLASLELARYFDSVDSLQAAERYFLDAIHFGENLKEVIPIQLAYRYLGLLYVETWQPEKAMKYLEKGILLAKEQKDDKTLLLCKVDLGILYSRKMDIDSAVKVLDEALYLAVKQEDNLAVVSILTSMAYLNEKAGDILEAIGLYHQIIEKCEENQFLPELGIMYNNLGNMYRNLDLSISLEYLMRADSIAKEIGNTELESLVLLNQGFTLMQGKDFVAAEKVLITTTSLSKRVGDSLRLAQAYGGLSHIHLERNECNYATVYLDSAFIIINSKADEFGRFSLEIEHALVENCKGNMTQAINSLQELYVIAEREGALSVQLDISRYLYEFSKNQANPKQSLEYLEQSLQLQEQMASDSVVVHSVLLYDKQRFIQDKMAQNQELKLMTNKSRTLLIMVIGLAILAVVLLILWLVNLRSLHKQSILEEKFTRKVDEIKSIIQEDTDEKLGRMDDIQLNDDLFIHFLKESYPSLSKLEVMICNLIRLNHTTKDIALKLNRSVGTIDNHRSAIRKKLGVSEAVNLPGFLQNLHSNRS